MEAISNLEMMVWLRGKIDACEEEIKYLEELLCVTSGPAEETINDLEVNRRRLKEYRIEFDRYLENQIRQDEASVSQSRG